MFKLACGDVMPGCAARFENTDRGALMADVASHAAADHGITDLTPEIVASVETKVVYTAA
jgi:predicted small metal-binding protein